MNKRYSKIIFKYLCTHKYNNTFANVLRRLYLNMYVYTSMIYKFEYIYYRFQ